MDIDDEFGLCMDPCEHPSLDGTTVENVVECMACHEQLRRIDHGYGLVEYVPL